MVSMKACVIAILKKLFLGELKKHKREKTSVCWCFLFVVTDFYETVEFLHDFEEDTSCF